MASANCALYCGANVDFVDIDPRTYNLSVPALAEKLETAESQGPVAEDCGAGTFRRPILRDARNPRPRRPLWLSHHRRRARTRSEANIWGARLVPATQGDTTIFSFHPVKIITTGEGGMAPDQRCRGLAERLSYLRTHGIVRPAQRPDEPQDDQRFNEERNGPWMYEQIELGPELSHDGHSGGARNQPDGSARLLRRPQARTRGALRHLAG